jgi:hypothetical protein
VVPVFGPKVQLVPSWYVFDIIVLQVNGGAWNFFCFEMEVSYLFLIEKPRVNCRMNFGVEW